MAVPITRGERVAAFVEKYCIVPSGAKVGQPMRLEGFQRRFILDIYDNPRGTKKGILSVGRKNAKSTTIAGLVLAHLAGPEAIQNSQIVSGAMSREQAAIVFDAACKMRGPELRELVKDVPSQKKLIGLSRNTEYKALAADGSTAQGLSPVLAILDEVGQVKGATDPFIDAIVTSQGAYENPLLILISTQAASDKAYLSLEIDDAMSKADPHTVVHLYAAEKDCDLLDEGQWRKANPALGVFRSESDVRTQAEAAQRIPAKEPAFRNLILNQRVEMFAPFVGRTAWKACDGAVEALAGQTVYAGLDLSAVTDLTALVLVWQKGGETHVKPYFWTPEQGLLDRAHRDRQPYKTWVDQGHLMTTPGATIDYEFVAKFMAELPVQFEVIAFDPWRMDQFKAAAERVGWAQEMRDKISPFIQGFKSMAPALDSLEKEILSQSLRHAGHPVLTMCAANATVEMDAAGNRKLAKHKSNGRIDGMVSLAMACGTKAGSVEEAKEYEILVF